MRRSSRRWLAWVMLVATLFAQASIAAYACPEPAGSAAAVATPCEQMDPSQPNLCERHCHDAGQSPSSEAALPGFAAAFVGCISLHFEPVAPGTYASPGVLDALHSPLAIRHCRLRI